MRKATHGFTLIELSIVLVIIGLIVGGVLVGQDLIKAAEIRATMGQIEKYNAAVNTFRGKYAGIPGDLQSTQASAFGLFGFTGANAGTIGMGDGNGLLEGSSAATGSTLAIGEPLAFWRHLSDANLIDGAYGSSGNSLIVASSGQATGNVTNLPQSLPPTKMGPVSYVAVYAASGLNYYELNSITTITAANGQYTADSPQIPPTQAYALDIKLDDGMPNTGTLVARGADASGVLNQPPDTTASTGCATGTASTDTYIRTNTSPICAQRFRFN